MTDALTDNAAREFLVPDLGEGLVEATVVEWLVAPGDSVTVNQPLCSLETAKAEVEIPSPFAGVVLERRGEPGETLLVGTLLTLIDTAPAGDAGSEDGAHLPGTEPGPVLVGYGTDRGTAARGRSVRRRPAPRRPEPTVTDTGRPRAKPPVRQLARALGVDLASLGRGSGPAGIITRADVHAAADSLATGAAKGPGTEPAAHTLPVRGIRARAAERMAMSRREIPDAHCSVTADFSRLLALRDGLRAGSGAEQATPFALLLRLLTLTLRDHPRLNASFVEEGPAVRTYDAIHLGIGTATPRGLVVPVVRDAHTMSTAALTEETARLAAEAREGTLGPGELTGSTFTVSNFGALGLDEGVPVINHPEAAILGVGSIRPRPYVLGKDALVVRPTAKLTCAFDHRVCDGAEAAAFLTALRDLVESPETVLLRI
ncbi:2-oxo acid dehydrogenase subunit E2 [Streptomyces sp. TM32]|uniref:dihydrolipoamide acetyltransferase family protein n=1 Tax=Streptomyces sp. TM32 TaxID=1652669 RepID=UPI00101193D7|nr:dihydrolipoamide acetyltransferase family protein [Streptomyces sp. TM32]RXS87569.1 2-oxo acid dehydrogenase subunit E2 [Streptomyces sp. TM32]